MSSASSRGKAEGRRMKADPPVRRPAAWLGALAVQFLLSCGAAAEPYRFDDIRLGASLTRLAQDLDFRDIHAAIAQQKEAGAVRPDLGRRGYGCARREDAFADIMCVSHDERV